MSLSLNETHKLVKDAARGSGMSWGEADELARAAVWLEVAGLPGLVQATRAIDEHINQLCADIELNKEEHWTLGPKFTGGDGRVSALAAATCAHDLVAGEIGAGSRKTVLEIRALFLPLIPAGALARLAPAPHQTIHIDVIDPAGETAMTISREGGDVRLRQSEANAIQAHPLVDLVVSFTASGERDTHRDGQCIWSPEIRQCALGNGLNPDPHALETLQAFAHNCLVPATEESRLKGAGAGTVDRD
ncbi:MAG: DUF3726 domain-containing protein [Hyphomicrobiaceae bacterium]